MLGPSSTMRSPIFRDMAARAINGDSPVLAFGSEPPEEEVEPEEEAASQRAPAERNEQPPLWAPFMNALGGAFKAVGLGRPSKDRVHDRHGFRRDPNPRRAELEMEWEAAHARRGAQQEQLWAQYEGDPQNLEPDNGAAVALRDLVRAGIPAARRKALWPKLAQADRLRAEAPGQFEALLEEARREPRPQVDGQIELDLPRTFPGHRYLGADGGIEELRSVLVAYSRRDASVGCECMRGMGCGMGPVTWVSKWPRRDRRSGPTGRHVQGVCA